MRKKGGKKKEFAEEQRNKYDKDCFEKVLKEEMK